MTTAPAARRLLALAFALFWGWNALSGALWSARQLDVPRERWRAALTLDEEQRAERWLRENEGRYGFRTGYPLDLLHALRELVPEDAVVTVVGSFQERAAGGFPLLQALCFPRRFEPLIDMPEGWPRSAADYDPRIHVVTFGSGAGRDLSESFVRLAGADDWTLWRCREGPR